MNIRMKVWLIPLGKKNGKKQRFIQGHENNFTAEVNGTFHVGSWYPARYKIFWLPVWLNELRVSVHKNQKLHGKFQNFKIAQTWAISGPTELFIAVWFICQMVFCFGRKWQYSILGPGVEKLCTSQIEASTSENFCSNSPLTGPKSCSNAPTPGENYQIALLTFQ